MDPTLRQAHPEDATDLAEICLLAGGGTFEFLYDGLTRNPSATHIIAALCRTDNTPYTYKHFHVAEDETGVLGGINAVSFDELGVLEKNVIPALTAAAGFGMTDLIRWAIRRLRLARILGAPRLPKNSLIICNLAVFPEHRNQGIAKQLLGHAVDIARRNQYDSVCLFVWQDNTPAIKLYESIGFEIFHTTKLRKHKRIPHEYRHLMQKDNL